MLGLFLSSYYEVYVVFFHAAVQLAVLLSLLVSADRILNICKYGYIKLRQKVTGKAPEDYWNYQILPADPNQYPKVAVQLPMFNERAVCQAIIDCCCELHWPSNRLKVQVLDDSTDKVTRELVDEKVAEWRERGIDIDVVRRTNRQGYKAGAMKEGMDLLTEYAYVAVFDADFKPEADFLERTIPYLEGNPQAQEVSLNYHCTCEQYTHFASGSFWNFQGTAGVWRRTCIETSGGWNSRTTVEDMDLSLRAYIRGWRAIFLQDVTCLNELPASFFAYRKQQHRWTCGPVQLWSKASIDIWRSQLPLLRKLELILFYFGVRKCSTHFVSFGFFCTLVPLSVFTPEVPIPVWALVHLPVAVTLSTAFFTRRGWVYSILYVLFENAMGTVKLWAVITGLLDLKRAQEWVVTTKMGSSDKRPGTEARVFVPSCKMYGSEVLMALFIMGAGFFGILSGHHWGMSAYLLLQGLVFLSFGFNWVDVGGLLGGRLDEDIVRTPVKASTTRGEVKRAATIPVIKLGGDDSLPISTPPAIDLHKSKSAPRRLNTSAVSSVLDAYEGQGSPTGDGTSSDSSIGDRTPDSGYSSGDKLSRVAAASQAVKRLWHSPTSSLTDIYAGRKVSSKSGLYHKGSGVKSADSFNYQKVAAANGYTSDHSD
ncbi:hypothetical protein N2152v2_007294 [Parachlorella kessleri]